MGRKRTFENVHFIETRGGGQGEVYELDKGPETYVVEVWGWNPALLSIYRKRDHKELDRETQLYTEIEDHMYAYLAEGEKGCHDDSVPVVP